MALTDRLVELEGRLHRIEKRIEEEAPTSECMTQLIYDRDRLDRLIRELRDRMGRLMLAQEEHDRLEEARLKQAHQSCLEQYFQTRLAREEQVCSPFWATPSAGTAQYLFE